MKMQNIEIKLCQIILKNRYHKDVLEASLINRLNTVREKK